MIKNVPEQNFEINQTIVFAYQDKSGRVHSRGYYETEKYYIEADLGLEKDFLKNTLEEVFKEGLGCVCVYDKKFSPLLFISVESESLEKIFKEDTEIFFKKASKLFREEPEEVYEYKEGGKAWMTF